MSLNVKDFAKDAEKDSARKRHAYPILQNLHSPEDLKRMDKKGLGRLAAEIRSYIKEVVEVNGGHLGPNLGSVELIMACHAVFKLDYDRLVFDVGHQVYPHKILSGRYKRFATLRREDGLSGYPSQHESRFDVFRGGHASTAVSTSLGLTAGYSLLYGVHADRDASSVHAKPIKPDSLGGEEGMLPKDAKGKDAFHKHGRAPQVVSIIGDGSMTGGMSFEGLNHTGHLAEKLIVILNDNSMSISPTVGGLAKALLRFRRSPFYNKLRNHTLESLKKIPKFGSKLETLTSTLINDMVTITSPSQIFTALGFHYFGPVNGHDVSEIRSFLEAALRINKPVLIHAITRKGGGYQVDISEKPPTIRSVAVEDSPHALSPKKQSPANARMPLASYSSVMAQALIKLGQKEKRVVGITAAMPEGTGLHKFEEKFADRYFDVGICEAHATGFAAGLAKSGMKPVFCVYSTFLQRAFDQMFHEIVLQQDLNVVFAIDRAGLVGEDGPSHQGLYDIAYTRIFPGFTVMAAKNGEELVKMLAFALRQRGPVAIRYPKSSIPPEDFFAMLKETQQGSISEREEHEKIKKSDEIELGKAEWLLFGKEVAFLSYGSTVYEAGKAALALQKLGIHVSLVNARFAKPVDSKCIETLAATHKHIVVTEEASITSGFGTATLEALASSKLQGQGQGHRACVHRLAVPDKLIEHASRAVQLRLCCLDSESLVEKVKTLLA